MNLQESILQANDTDFEEATTLDSSESHSEPHPIWHSLFMHHASDETQDR